MRNETYDSSSRGRLSWRPRQARSSVVTRDLIINAGGAPTSSVGTDNASVSAHPRIGKSGVLRLQFHETFCLQSSAIHLSDCRLIAGVCSEENDSENDSSSRCANLRLCYSLTSGTDWSVSLPLNYDPSRWRVRNRMASRSERRMPAQLRQSQIARLSARVPYRTRRQVPSQLALRRASLREAASNGGLIFLSPMPSCRSALLAGTDLF